MCCAAVISADQRVCVCGDNRRVMTRLQVQTYDFCAGGGETFPLPQFNSKHSHITGAQIYLLQKFLHFCFSIQSHLTVCLYFCFLFFSFCSFNLIFSHCLVSSCLVPFCHSSLLISSGPLLSHIVYVILYYHIFSFFFFYHSILLISFFLIPCVPFLHFYLFTVFVVK